MPLFEQCQSKKALIVIKVENKHGRKMQLECLHIFEKVLIKCEDTKKNTPDYFLKQHEFNMALHLAFDYAGFLGALSKDDNNLIEKDDEDDIDVEERKKKERLINHRNGISSKNLKPETIAILVCILFVVATTTYTVYSGSNDSPEASNKLSKFSFAEVKYDSPIEGELYNEPRLPKHFIPVKYILYLNPNMTAMIYTGLVKIKVKCKADTNTIAFHSAHHNVGKIAIKTLNVTDIEDISVTKAERNLQREMVILHLNQHLVKGYLYEFYIGFHGNLSDSIINGMVVTSTKDKNGKVVNTLSTMFLPNLAHQVFPCFDEPEYRAVFQLIIQHDKNFQAISNMGIQQVVQINDNLETHFKQSPPLSTYQISFVIGQLVSREVTTPRGTTVKVFAPDDVIEDVGLALSVAPKLLSFIEKELKFNYTNSKLDLVCVPHLSVSSLPSYGIVQMSGGLLLYDYQNGTMFEEESVTMELAKVVSAQWFGGIVTFDWWNSEWLINGLAKYMQRYSLAKVFGHDRDYNHLYYDRFYQAPLRNDESKSSKGLMAAVDAPHLNEELYEQPHLDDKAALILSMLSVVTGEPEFFKTLTAFLENQQYTASDSSQFADLFVLYSPENDVVDFLHYWQEQPGFPLVKAKNGPLGRQLSVVQNFFVDGTDTEWTLWRFVMLVKYSCSSKVYKYELLSHNELFPFPISCSNETNGLPSKDWYKVNAGARGFYRADYSKENWIAIKQQFDQNHEMIAATDRANLMDDIFELAIFDYHSISDALTFTLYLKAERDYLPMETALRQLNYVVSMATDETVKKCLKEYIAEQIVPTFNYVAPILNKTIEEKHLFHLLVNLIVDRQDGLSEGYIREYDIAFLQWILSSERNELPNYLRDVIMKVGIKYGTKYEWNDMERYYANAKTDAEKDLIIKTLAVQEKYIEEANNTLSSMEFFQFVLYSCANNDDAKYIALDMLQEPDIYNGVIRKPDLMERFMWNCIGQIKTDARLREVKAEFEKVNLQPFMTLYRKVIESIERNINFANNQTPEMYKWLKQHRHSCVGN